MVTIVILIILKMILMFTVKNICDIRGKDVDEFL